MGTASDDVLLVVGSINEDVVVDVPSLPGPGVTVIGGDRRTFAGGKGANQAVAAALAGAPTWLLGAVGDDASGRWLLSELERRGVATDQVEVVDASTGGALITVDPRGENVIVVSPGANHRLDPDHVRATADRLGALGIVLSQGEVRVDVVSAAAVLARERGARFVLNLAPVLDLPARDLGACDPLVLNEHEYAELTGDPAPASREGAALAARELRERCGCPVVLTLGAAGAVYDSDEGVGHVPAPMVSDVVDTTGAGDAFVGVLAAALLGGAPLGEAVEAGVRAGSFAVGRSGAQASFPTTAELAAMPGGTGRRVADSDATRD